MKPIRLICVVGARPNFMKIAPLLRLLRQDPDFTPILVHTGQHYDDQLSGQFFRDLELPAPDHYLCIGSGSHAQQTAQVLKLLEPVMIEERAGGVVVVGDVNSTMAAALTAAKLRIPVFHIEAGLRSFDRAMPEEINRVITDSISDALLVTEESGRANLLREGIPDDRIHLVGNLMIDSLRANLAKARQCGILKTLGIDSAPFGVVTLHRPANVDQIESLGEIIEALAEISQSVPLFFPVHPRTRSHLERIEAARRGNITTLDPLGYLDFLCLMSRSSIVLTDSGGIQEETTALGIPCLTLRENTERPITISEGTNRLAGTKRASILAAWEELQASPKAGRIPPLWDGAAAERCVGVFRRFYALAGETCMV